MSVKTTVYLPEELKASLERESERRGCSEAEVIRDAIARVVSRPKPRAGFIKGDVEPLAERVEELLKGFGEH